MGRILKPGSIATIDDNISATILEARIGLNEQVSYKVGRWASNHWSEEVIPECALLTKNKTSRLNISNLWTK